MTARAARRPVLGKYALVAKLATGGMAEIMLARMRGAAGFEKLVVLKRLLPHLADERHHIEMFLDEARIAARITHPNVCQVYELGQERGRYVIVMEYLEGVTVGRVIRRLSPGRSPFDLRLIAGIARQACDGLHHAHELRDLEGRPAGLVHRDVSPQNLFVTVDGVVKVLDFGIAKTEQSSVKTRTGTIKGKTAYMSPEQVRAETLDRRSDLFSLGVVLIEAVTGENVFRRENDFLTYKAITEEKVRDPLDAQTAAPPAFLTAIRSAVARDRARRPPTARALGDALCDTVPPLAASAIAEWMEAQFGEEIRDRRARIAEALAQVADGNDDEQTDVDPEEDSLPTVPTDVAEPTRPAAASTSITRDSEIDETLPPASAPDLPSIRRRTPWGAIAAAGVAACALAALAWFAIGGRPGDLEPLPGEPAARRDPNTRSSANPPSSHTDSYANPPSSHTDSYANPPSSHTDSYANPPSSHTDSYANPRNSHTDSPANPSTPATTGTATNPATTGSSSAPDPGRTRRARPAATEPGFFTIDSRPYATIHIDGKEVGVTPLLRHPLSPGSHVIRATLADGRVKQFRILVESGKEAPRRRLNW